MTLTLSPLEAISRTKKRDTLKTNVFLWGEGAPPSHDHHETGPHRTCSFSASSPLLFVTAVEAAVLRAAPTPGSRSALRERRGFWLSQPPRTKIPIYVSRYTSEKKGCAVGRVLACPDQNHTLRKILSIRGNISVLLLYRELFQGRCSPPKPCRGLDFTVAAVGITLAAVTFSTQIKLGILTKYAGPVDTPLPVLNCPLEVPGTANSHT